MKGVARGCAKDAIRCRQIAESNLESRAMGANLGFGSLVAALDKLGVLSIQLGPVSKSEISA